MSTVYWFYRAVVRCLSPPRATPTARTHEPGASGSMLTLPTFSFYAAWTLLLGLFACAYVQGAEFASTKETATVFGCVIGLAAFFSWLAVEDDDEDDEDNEDDEDESSVGDGATAKQKAS